MTNSEVKVNLDRIMTPASRCICLRLGKIDGSALKSLEDNDYDFAPVLDEADLALGLISTVRAKELAPQCGFLTSADLEREHLRLPETVDLNRLLTALRNRPAILVGPEMGADAPPIVWTGFLTIYDLNRHYFRALLYSLIAELEVSLASTIEAGWRDPWDWIEILNEEEQARIIGYWRLAERRHADIGPTAAFMLTQLLKVTGRDKRTLTDLGFQSKSEFEQMSGSFPELRNQIMHPVRPLILRPQDTERLADRIEKLRDLNLRFAKLKEQRAASAKV